MRYQPFRDPLFWAGVVLYFLNKFWMQSYFDSPFLKGYVTDLVAVPIGLPFIIWLLQTLKLRDDSPPHVREVLVLVLICSLLFEVIMPPITLLGKFGRGDVFDVLAYAAGGVIAMIWWFRGYRAVT